AQVLAHARTLEAAVDVGGILCPGNAPLAQESPERGSPRAQERTNEPDAPVVECGGRDARPSPPLSACKAPGERFGLIVRWMTGKHEVGTGLPGRFRQKRKPRRPRRGGNSRLGFRPFPAQHAM